LRNTAVVGNLFLIEPRALFSPKNPQTEKVSTEMAIGTNKLTRQAQNKKEEASAIDQQLVRLEDDVRRLKIEFDIFFNGGNKRAPHEMRGRVESNIKRVADNRNLSYAQRYLFNSIVSRYTAYRELWRRMLKQRNEPSF
jgi:hypothetical protein